MIRFADSKLHWNYFLALEHDVEVLARYIEFNDTNRNVFSLELAHLLFAASSEVDVVSKSLCRILAQGAKCKNIDHYRTVITKGLPDFAGTEVSIPRYGMTLMPWENWKRGKNPDWWRSYNNVKHERDKHFREATLQNTLNSVGALLVTTFKYYHCAYSLRMHEGKLQRLGINEWDTYRTLKPKTSLFKMAAWSVLGLSGLDTE